MKRFYYDPETRTFSDQQTARGHAGELDEVIIHLLKLEYEFNYDLDHDKHIRDIANWIYKCKIDQLKDRSSRGPVRVMDYYQKDLNKVKLSSKISKLFKDKYGWTGQIMVSDINEALLIMTQCMMYTKKSDIIGYLYSEFPIK